MKLWRALTYRGVDLEGEVLKYPEFLDEARHAGEELCMAL
jgi:hypothetical protein